MIDMRRALVLVLMVTAGAVSAATQTSAPAPSDKADALSAAARKGDVAAVKKLLDEGVDVNTKFRYNATALSFAADRGHVEVVKLLIERGADVNAKDTFYGATPLTWAVGPAMGRTPQHPAVVGLLLQHGAQGKEQALMAAMSDAATVKVILDSGGISSGSLSDALEMATKAKRSEIIALLEHAGAKPHVEMKLDAADLARYVGTYRGALPGQAQATTLAVTAADGRLTTTLGGQRLTLIARDKTTFGVAEQPGTRVTFRLEQDKATSITLTAMGNSINFTRAEEK